MNLVQHSNAVACFLVEPHLVGTRLSRDDLWNRWVWRDGQFNTRDTYGSDGVLFSFSKRHLATPSLWPLLVLELLNSSQRLKMLYWLAAKP